MTVCTGTVSGMPARNMAMRHSLARCEEGPRTLPMTTSPTSAAGTPVRANVALKSVASMSSAGVLARPPRRACTRAVPALVLRTAKMIVGRFRHGSRWNIAGAGSEQPTGQRSALHNERTLQVAVRREETITTSSEQGDWRAYAAESPAEHAARCTVERMHDHKSHSETCSLAKLAACASWWIRFHEKQGDGSAQRCKQQV